MDFCLIKSTYLIRNFVNSYLILFPVKKTTRSKNPRTKNTEDEVEGFG